MPLPVRDYSWHETADKVMISIPLKGVKREKVDILSTDDYIKGKKSRRRRELMSR